MATVEEIYAKYGMKKKEDSVYERATDALIGAIKNTIGSVGSALSTSVQAGQSNLMREEEIKYERDKQTYAKMLADNMVTPGKWDQKILDAKKKDIETTGRMLEVGKEAVAQSGLVQGANKVREGSSNLMASGAKDIARAKEGLGGVGQFVVDAGVAGTQLAGDMLVGAMTGGVGALPMMAVRSFGAGAEEARLAGASLDQQVAYGLGNAALGVAAEKIANVAKPFKNAFKAGMLDEAIEEMTKKLGQSAAGKITASAFSEFSEELVEAVIQPVLQRAAYDPSASFDLGEALYQAAIGGVLGGAGGAVDVLSRNTTKTAQQATPAATTPLAASQMGVNTTRNNNSPQGVKTPSELNLDEGAKILLAPLQQKNKGKKAPTAKEVYSPENIVRIMVEQQKTAPEVGTTSVDTNPETHTKEENRRITEYVNATNTNLTEWINRVRTAFSNGDTTATKMKKILGEVKENTANAIRAVCGVDVTGFKHMIDGSAIKHIDERHGEFGKADSSMTAAEDIARVEYILENFDGYEQVLNSNGSPDYSSQFRDRNNKPAPMVRFYKKVDGTYYVVEAVPDSADRKLHIVSAYMKTNDGGINQVLNMEDKSNLQLTSETPLDPVASVNVNSNIPQVGDSVNFEAAKRRTRATRDTMPDTAKSAAPVINAQSEPPQSSSDNYNISQSENPVNFGATKNSNSATSEPYAPTGVDTSTVRPGRSEPAPVANPTVPQTENAVNSGTVGAAAAGFLTPDHPSVERISRQKTGALAYNGRKGEAASRTRAEYDEMFRYMSRPEAQSMQEATNLLFYQRDGENVFLGDIDPEGLQEMMEYMRSVPAWNDVLADVGHLLEQEFRRRAAFSNYEPGENSFNVTEDDYYNWSQTIRSKVTETARGVQAQAKWTRTGNSRGQATEADAWEKLENSGLSEEECRARFQEIVRYDQAIEAAETDAELKQIILDIAQRRGTLSGLTGKQSRTLKAIAASALDHLGMEELQQFAYASSAALSGDAVASNAGQKMKTIQILNMLSNPKTAAKNLAGNTSFYTLDAMTMRGAALLDMVLSRITGTRSMAMEGSVLGHRSREAISKAIQMSLAEVTMDVDMGGDSRYRQGGRRNFKADGGAGLLGTNTSLDKFAERILSACERNMGYLMTSTDEAYKGAARSTRQATQQLIDEGKIKNAGEDYAGEQAEKLALYRTFQNDGKTAAAIRGLRDLGNMIVGIGDSGRKFGKLPIHSFGLGDLVAPFTSVAGNLASVGMDYSPVNAVKGTVEILDVIRRAAGGNVDPTRQATAVSDFARGMSGTAIAYGVMILAKAGLIKRAEDEQDEDVAALNQSEGMMGTQINIDAAQRWINGGDQKWKPGDTLIDMSNLEPLNFIVSLGVELADNEVDSFLSMFVDVDTYKDTALSAAETAGDLPILSSVGDFATDVLMYHNNPFVAGAEMLGKTAISSLTPNALAAYAKGQDDKQRSTYSGEGVTDVLIDTIKSRIPGLREQLPTAVNTLGEEKPNPGTIQQRIINAMINPIGVNQYSQSEVSQEMERVREATGETDFYPSKKIPSELSATKDGKNKVVELDYEQRQDFQRDRGVLTMVTMTGVLGTKAYKNADSKVQSDLLKDAQTYAYEAAKANVMGDSWVDKWVKETMKAQKQTGLNPAMVIAYRDMMSREADRRTQKQAKAIVREAIFADRSLTNEQKGALDDIVVSDWTQIKQEVTVDYTNRETFTISQMSDGAQSRWERIKKGFKMSAEDYQQAWSIYQDDDLKAAEKRRELSALGYDGAALYTALGKK